VFIPEVIQRRVEQTRRRRCDELGNVDGLLPVLAVQKGKYISVVRTAINSAMPASHHGAITSIALRIFLLQEIRDEPLQKTPNETDD
jgi:hypothetical protein